jgi:hypothetical protein
VWVWFAGGASSQKATQRSWGMVGIAADASKLLRSLVNKLMTTTPRPLGKQPDRHGPEDYEAAFEEGLAQRDSKALMELLVKVSVARCARVSYLTHDGKRDLQADLELHDRLLTSGHMSPFEHAARPMTDEDVKQLDVNIARVTGFIDTPTYQGPVRRYNRWLGNFRGWVQYRKLIPHEADILAPR